jgi:predicted dinucleotide-binding enzyme
MLYGTQELRATAGDGGGDEETGELKLTDAALRVVQYVRASVVEAFHVCRATTMTPDAQAAHPCATAALAGKLLRAYVDVDWYV